MLSKLYHIFTKSSRWGSILFLFGFMAMVTPSHAVYADTVGERHTFFVDRNFDALGRTAVPATLVAVGQHGYIYIEDSVWSRYGGFQNATLSASINRILNAFDTVIYPADTLFWGSEPNPGIDNDPHVLILFEQLTRGTGGYTDTSNLYPVTQVSDSNQREMVSLNASALFVPGAEEFLVHEFEHLISANQKTLRQSILEDTWLDELRAQYSVTLGGYNSPFKDSDLYGRMRDFLDQPTDSLTEWRGTNTDYAPVTLFGHYLVDQYGPSILKETLIGPLNGIDSIDAWLANHGYRERFADVFANWLVANYLNDQTADKHYGYSNPDLKNIHVSPIDTRTLSYPKSTFSFVLAPWQPEWYKFYTPSAIPSGENLKISWSGSPVGMVVLDAQGTVRKISSGDIIPVLANSHLVLMPYYHPAGASASRSEIGVNASLNFEFTAEKQAPAVIPDGSLIKRPGEADVYVIEGKYKRYLAPAVIALYGHLDPSKAFELDSVRFDSYTTTNYVRYVDEQKVYAVWPDMTKHWLHMSAQTFSETGRDWNSIFIINQAELDTYKTGPEITR